MIRVRFIQNTVLFTKGGRQIHAKFGEIYAVEKLNEISDRQLQLVFPGPELLEPIDRDIVEIYKDIPKSRSTPGCGGCGGKK